MSGLENYIPKCYNILMQSQQPAIRMSFQLIRDELLGRGFEVELLPLDKPNRMTRFIAPGGGEWLTKHTTVAYPFIDLALHRLTGSKQLSYQYARSKGVTVPATLAATRSSAETEAFLRKHGTLIVKPASSFGSRGLTLNIQSPEVLKEAIEYALQHSEQALLQKQVNGDEVRITIIEGKAVSVILRQTPRVVGDGSSTVAELIARENEARTTIPTDVIAYPQLDDTIIPAQYLTDSTVLEDGQVLELSRSTLAKTGASMINITDTIDRSYTQAAEALVAGLNPQFLVVDMMLQDYSRPITPDNYAFIEFNTSPSLRLYYGVRHGARYDILPVLAAMIEKRIKP